MNGESSALTAIASCRVASRLMSIALDRPLLVRERLAMHTHLALCAACRAYRRQIRRIDAILRTATAAPLPGGEALDAAAREHIRVQLHQAWAREP